MLVLNDPTADLKAQPNARFRFRLQHLDDPSLRHFIFIFECWDAKGKKASGYRSEPRTRSSHVRVNIIHQF
jgi:hypothetical protein